VPGKRHLTFKHPVGVVGAIGPWNFPITLLARKIAPSLAVGCTIVCTPATQTPLTMINVFDIMIEAGLPAGVATYVIGSAKETAEEFLANPLVKKISFTGSTEVGNQLMRAAADQVKRLSLELGGHAPFIVFPLLIVMNDKAYLRDQTNGLLTNVLTSVVILIAFVIAIVAIPLEVLGG
jgi:succinate-semialdehyde dehydrogenase/glutarate-semialdehyde dehydrogenase